MFRSRGPRQRPATERRRRRHSQLTASSPTPPPVEVSERTDAPLAPAKREPTAPGSSRRGREGTGTRKAVALWVLALVVLFAIVMPLSEEGRWLNNHRFDARALGGGLRGLPTLEAESQEPAEAPPPVVERADAEMFRDRHSGFAGGIVFVPKTFSSDDGQFDLLLHFHGNTGVVRESTEVAGLNAIVAIINLGEGSLPYEEAYMMPRTYERLLARIERIVRQRGLENARIRRVALSSWSAGYGAISKILEVRKGIEPLDAVLVLDGIHCGYVNERRDALNPLQLASFLGAARRAASDEILFSITHTDIEPRRYASASETASYLLEGIGGTRVPRYAEPGRHVSLLAAEGAVSKKLEKHLRLTSEGKVGSFHVRGYRGDTPQDHMAHLLQVATTVLPELAVRWNVQP